MTKKVARIYVIAMFIATTTALISALSDDQLTTDVRLAVFIFLALGYTAIIIVLPRTR